jgi:hypothetical protein
MYSDNDINKCDDYLQCLTGFDWSFSAIHLKFYLSNPFTGDWNINVTKNKLLDNDIMCITSSGLIIIEVDEILSTMRNNKINEILNNG